MFCGVVDRFHIWWSIAHNYQKESLSYIIWLRKFPVFLSVVSHLWILYVERGNEASNYHFVTPLSSVIAKLETGDDDLEYIWKRSGIDKEQKWKRVFWGIRCKEIYYGRLINWVLQNASTHWSKFTSVIGWKKSIRFMSLPVHCSMVYTILYCTFQQWDSA